MINIETWAYRRLLALAEANGEAEMVRYLKARFMVACDLQNRRAKTRQGEPPVIGSAYGLEEK